MTVETTVLVVGGGATGVGVARDLALRGVDVTLVERDGLAGAATGRSHGLLHSGARYADTDASGAAECIAENRILRETAGACVRETGGLFLQVAGDDPDYFDEKRVACENAGIPVEERDPAAVRATVPDVAADVERALQVPDSVVYPSRLVAANAADARDHGARIHTNAPVEDVNVADGQVASVRIGGRLDHEVEPEYVVNAAGAWAGHLAAMAGATVEMQPTRGVMVAVDYPDLNPALNRCREPADGDIIVPHPDQAVLGSTSVSVDDPDEYPREDWEVDRIIAECAAMLPPVADAAVARTWWGVRPLYAPDEMNHERGISRGFVLLDHDDATPDDAADVDGGPANIATIVGGKLTTYRRMAEATAELVCDRLGVDADCVTADRPLPGADDPDRLDELTREFDAHGPADADV